MDKIDFGDEEVGNENFEWVNFGEIPGIIQRSTPLLMC